MGKGKATIWFVNVVNISKKYYRNNIKDYEADLLFKITPSSTGRKLPFPVNTCQSFCSFFFCYFRREKDKARHSIIWLIADAARIYLVLQPLVHLALCSPCAWLPLQSACFHLGILCSCMTGLMIVERKSRARFVCLCVIHCIWNGSFLITPLFRSYALKILNILHVNSVCNQLNKQQQNQQAVGFKWCPSLVSLPWWLITCQCYPLGRSCLCEYSLGCPL